MTQYFHNNIKKEKNVLIVAGGTLNEKSIAANQNKLLQILVNIFDNIYYITFCERKNEDILNKGNILDLNNINYLRLFNNSQVNFMYAQVAVTTAILKNTAKKNFDTVLFTMGQDLQIIPIFVSKLLRKKVIIRSSGSPSTVLKNNFKSKSLFKIMFFRLIEKINYAVADLIFVECEYAIKENGFNKFGNVHVASLFVNFDLFKYENMIGSRFYDVGYIGGFSEAKGILNFIDSIPLFLNEKHELNIFIAGNGNQKEEVMSRIESMNLPNIRVDGWISNEDLPKYLNSIKLLVLPSIKEGLPNMIMEGIACGTVILATAVGAIPGLIKDEDTGFIMDNNSPACVAENVLRVLNYPNLELIVDNARNLVVSEFSYEAVLDRYKTIFNNIL